MISTIRLSCPSCASSVLKEQKNCDYCGSEIIIKSISQISSMPLPQVNKYANSYRQSIAASADAGNDRDLNISLGLCYMRLKLFDKAIDVFETATKDNFDNPSVYYYLSMAMLKGQKAYVAPRPSIDKIIEYMNAALMIEDKGIYYYLLAYIKRDYFHRKFLNTTPDYTECKQSAIDRGVSEAEITELFNTLMVERPDVL